MRIIRYGSTLLGELPGQEESELEEAYFSDSELLARVELARDDLADDYAAARLSPADRAKFERRILATADGRGQLAISRALRQASAGASETPKRPGWRLDHRWLGVAAGVLLAIGAIFAWRVFSGPSRAPDSQDASAQRPSQPDPATPTSTPNPGERGAPPPAGDRSTPGSSSGGPAITLATLILTADLDRSKGRPPTLLASTGATHVDLVAPRAGLTAGAARARIESVEGAPIWSGSISVPAADAPDARPRARVPVSALPPGDYLLAIEPAGSKDPTGGPRFYFRVRAR